MQRLNVHGVTLHYTVAGAGEPLVLLHGGLSDLRAWRAHIPHFATRYQVIAYSRRYHYPNRNVCTSRTHSARVEAADLAALLQTLDLAPAHLVGTSYGALTALTLAIEHPSLVRTLVLAEPPVHAWLKEDTIGRRVYRDFMTQVWQPARTAFADRQPRLAMRILTDGFAGPGRFDHLDPCARSMLLQNTRAMRALVESRCPFPPLSRDAVRSLRIPCLIQRGEHTTLVHALGCDRLRELLFQPAASILPGCGHWSVGEQRPVFIDQATTFLSKAAYGAS